MSMVFDEGADQGRTTFLDRLGHAGIPERAIRVLNQAGARTPEEVIALVRAFPSIGAQGLVDFASLTERLAQVSGEKYALASLLMEDEAKSSAVETFSFGARPPENAEWSVGVEVELADIPDAPKLQSATQLVSMCSNWRVRDQGQRGTCVAFATCAAIEQMLCRSGGSFSDQSEQFAYWAIKNEPGEPFPDQDGSTLEFGQKAIISRGSCQEALWAYNPAIGQTVDQGAPNSPSQGALQQALSFRPPSDYASVHPQHSGKAPLILAELILGRAVAVTLPVFADPITRTSNWSTLVSRRYGAVADPPPTSRVDGGHAVCIVGFAEDRSEPLGGYFIIRNSWDTVWGHDLPAQNYYGPAPGYGQISASYIDRYLWEMLSF